MFKKIVGVQSSNDLWNFRTMRKGQHVVIGPKMGSKKCHDLTEKYVIFCDKTTKNS